MDGTMELANKNSLLLNTQYNGMDHYLTKNLFWEKGERLSGDNIPRGR